MGNMAILGVHYGRDAKDIIDIDINVGCLGCGSNLVVQTPWHENKPFDVTCVKCEKHQTVYPEHKVRA